MGIIADRTVSVRLTAAVQDFMRNMSEASRETTTLTARLEQLDGKKVRPEIVVDVDHNQIRNAVSGLANTADDEARRRSPRFFGALLTPNPAVLQALRTGIPAVLGSPLGVAAASAGALFAASFASAVISSGAFAAIGGGFTVLGALALKENTRIQAAFAETADSIKNSFAVSAGALLPVFEEALGAMPGLFSRHIRVPLEDIFAGLAPTIMPFLESAAAGIGEVLDDLATPEFLSGMQEILSAISDQLPRLGSVIGEFFRDLASNSDQIAASIENIVTTISGLLEVTAFVLNTMTTSFNTFFSENSTASLNWMQEWGKNMGIMLAGTSDADSTLQGMTDSMALSATQASSLSRATSDLEDETERVNERLDEERDKLDQLRESLFLAGQETLSVRDAQRGFEAAVDEASESLERNGETLDINTEAGRENQESIDQIAEAAHRQIQAMIEQGASTKDVTKFTKSAREEFINAADAAGLERKQAKRLADQLGLVPSEVKTKIEAIDNATSKIDALEKRLRDLENEIIHVEIQQSFTTTGRLTGFRGTVHDGGLIMHDGGPVTRMHMGGPRHDERDVRLQTGEFVVQRPAVQSLGVDAMQQINQGRLPGASGPITIENHIEIGGEVVRVVSTQISEHDRTLKSRVRAGAGLAR